MRVALHFILLADDVHNKMLTSYVSKVEPSDIPLYHL